MTAQYVLGIDLGTTNSVLCYAPLAAEAQIEVLPIPQLVAADTVESRTMLPSFTYLASQHETGGGALDLPWAKGRDFAVGEFARRQAAEVPERTVGAAKSWLAYSRVDRHQPLLPWGAPADVPKISPVAASRRYLEHLVAAWEAAFPSAPAAEQMVVLTVPASFDASARELTREAALAAGLPAGPRAAGRAAGGRLCLAGRSRPALAAKPRRRRYPAGLRRRRRHHRPDAGRRGRRAGRAGPATAGRRQPPAGRRRQHGPGPGPFRRRPLRREGRQARSLAIGCALAFLPRGQGSPAGRHADGPKKHPVAVLGRGSRVIGGTVSVEVDRRQRQPLAAGRLLSRVPGDDRPARRGRRGFRELGLPYEADTAITRHLAAFLQAHGGPQGEPVRPDARALQRRRFKAEALRGRLLEVLGQWFGPQRAHGCWKAGTTWTMPSPAAPPITAGRSSAAACEFAAARPGPTMSASRRPAWPCPAPRGRCGPCASCPSAWKRATEADVPSDEIGLVVGQPAQFRFFSSSVRKEDRPGDVLGSLDAEELAETDSLETTLPAVEGSRGRLRAGAVPLADHRVGRVGVVVRQHEASRPLEAGVQRPPSGGGRGVRAGGLRECGAPTELRLGRQGRPALGQTRHDGRDSRRVSCFFGVPWSAR